MRRLLSIVLTLAAATAVALLLGHSSAQGSSTARFDVIFDDARGLIGGQLVKIAGAKAGIIENVVVTPDFKARVEASIDSQFMPFHKDATCTIRPEGLIAENYVDCDPGTMGSPLLQASGGKPPTVPVANTTEPVSLLDLFNMFNLPTRQRFTALIDELGIGTAGRGADFNDILLRANPALAKARVLIGILNRQKAQLGAIIDATGTIAKEGASHPVAVQNFLDRASALSTLTAAHKDNLSLSVARLPGLLAAAQPTLRQLDTVARGATPLVSQLHASVPALTRVENDLGPFVHAATPALADLRTSLRKATPAIRHTTPLVEQVRSYVTRSLPGTQLFARLASNLQQHGFAENFLSVFYYVGASLSRFDATSHMLALLLVGAQNGMCGNYATTPVNGCSAHYGAQSAYSASAAPRNAGPARKTGPGATHTPTPVAPAPSSGQPGRSGSGSGSSTGGGSGTSAPPPPPGSGPVQQTLGSLNNLVGYLLK